MPGTVLLLAAAPAGRGRLVDAASVLPVLAAVPPPVLSGTSTANVVERADPQEPQAVLTRLRAAAVSPGPLTLCFCVWDRENRALVVDLEGFEARAP